MSIDHILASITNTPLMITPDKLSVIMDVLGSRQHISLDLGKLEGLMPSPSAAAPVARPAAKTGAVGIATISIVGSMVNRSSAGESGMVTYRSVKRQLDSHMANPDVGGILLDIDSHGGMAAGVHRLAIAIREASQIKPIYAFVDTSAFSAGYYLASAATKVILADDAAGVGSVGVIALHRDQSAHNEKEGYVYTAIYSGARKTDYSPHQPLAEELLAKIQKSVDTSRAWFAAAVAEFRGLSRDAVMATEAGLFYGKEAIAAGLADTIATLEETVVMLVENIIDPSTTTKTGGSEMTTQERLEALISKNDDAPAALAALGFVQADKAEATAKAEGHKEGVAAGLAQAKEILDVVAISGAPLAMATTMIEKGLTQEEAVAAVQQYRANLSNGQTVTSTVTTFSGDAKHPLIAACEKKAA
ncbi:MAG: S49 family peptidase [Proteobacteria bacterium]|nr:S49 family peptidase [Pseudomonadota bacterium]